MPGVLETVALIVSSIATTTLAANALYLGTLALGYAGLALGASLLQGLLVSKPSVPKPEDGSYNLKQNVPPLTYVLGRVKKGGDYVFLEEGNGTAYHVTVMAAHPVSGYLQHYLHDEKVAITPFGADTGGWVTSPDHFVIDGYQKVLIRWRVGQSSGIPYGDVVAAFPSIWDANHRGDGLSTVLMACATVESKNYLSVYPNQMPQHSAVVAGHSGIYDPRSGTNVYSENIALHRLWHLTSPVGGRMTIEDMHLPDWIAAADVCDELVLNRAGVSEPRYHGGFWFRANNEPTEVGRVMDQAAELVVFERPDGKIGVHAGRFVEPDVRLTRNDIISAQLDGNTRDSSTVLAVRGRFVDTTADYVTADAAIYGNPYQADDDSERTKTLDNAALQRHNHVQRLQKIAYIRANAKKVAILAHYEAAENVPYRRFVRVHLPPKMEEVIVEITATPRVSLRSLTVEFSGIIVPSSLYGFVASVEEGAPPSQPDKVDPSGVPTPTGFTVLLKTEVVSGGATAAYALASWSPVSEVLTHELELERTDVPEPIRSTTSTAGQSEVRSQYLVDGGRYRFRLRAWGGGTPSQWTGYILVTATADPVAPDVVSAVSATGGTGQITFTWNAPNSGNYFASRLYLNTSNSFTGATLVGTEYGSPSASDSRVIAGLTAGVRYGFVVAINASGVPAVPVATGAATVI
ncbi:hypothetical protein HGO37_07865 [Rhizobium sp. CG4]|uniref:hypothetical protein n=1 Tax=Rhizobium sp. CG4 TaxID=2726075 RepID=UPI0020345183|nr:hypothetical protein [Rhizobium sp. CG4]MCM2455296.1 hypothetical protein [Rhizobium sp. CG4]